MARLICFAAVLLLVSVSAANTYADLTVTLTGTVETGAIDGVGIDGEAFTMTSTLLDGIDLESDLTDQGDVGVFALSEAEFRTQSTEFIFDTSSLFFVQGYIANTDLLAVGFSAGNNNNPRYAEQFYYYDERTAFMNDSVDLDYFQPLSWSDFNTSEIASLTGDGTTATFFNGDHSLQISSLSTVGASVTAVPEPDVTCIVGMAGLAIAWMRRRRQG